MLSDYDVSLSEKEGYEEITVEDFIKRENLDNNEQRSLLNKSFAVNIHIMISEETLGQVYETFTDFINKDERLSGLNAIVLLSLKTKGRGKSFTPLSQEKFKKLVTTALDNDIPIGFDSCSCHKFLDSVKDHDKFEQFEMLSEPCESACFSSYINTKGDFYPCSFAENQGEWKTGIKVDTCIDFLKDVWYNEKTIKFRNELLRNKRNCVIYDV